MARDIEEFLRRAAERRQQQQNQNQRQPPPPSQRIREIIETADVEVVADEVEVVQPRKTLQPSTPGEPARDLRRESVVDHVQKHINTTDISDHAEHLGEDIQQADDRIAERLRRKFSHDVSKLDDRPTVQDDLVATVTQSNISALATELIAMLSSPPSIRQAILISEILNRRDFD